MKLSKALMMTAMAVCFAAPAMAADSTKGDTNSHWAMMDTNGDGKISKSEWMAAAEKKFDEIDTNHDGFISKDEWATKGKMMKHNHHAMSTGGSTSTPADANQAAPSKAPAAEGADGAGGSTAQ